MKSIKVILTISLLCFGVLLTPHTISAADQTQCSSVMESFASCDFLTITKAGDEIYANSEVNISGLIDPRLNDKECETAGRPAPFLIVNGPDGKILKKKYRVGSTIDETFTPTQVGEHNINLNINVSTLPGRGTLPGKQLTCDYNFYVCAPGNDECSSFLGNSSDTEPYSICETNLNPGSAAYGACATCYSSGGIWTAIGCINQSPQAIVSKLINFGIGISGGIALLIILASAFSLTISQGDVKKTGDAKEWLTSAVIGLLFIIFSVSLLEFIGSTVLRIPGFGG